MRRSTIIYVLLFLIALGAYFFVKLREAGPKIGDVWTPEPTVTPIAYLFTSTDGLPTRIKIEAKTGEVVDVVLNEENVWAMTLPKETAADQGSVDAAAGQVSTMRILERIPNLAPEAVGLDNPDFKLTIQFTSGVERIIEIGVITPTQSGYYVRGENGEILIISRGAVDSLIGLLTNLPYAPTETPAPAMTP